MSNKDFHNKMIEVQGELSVGKNVSIDSYVIFKGKVILGDDVKIGAFCIIEDSHIEANTVIKEFTTISKSKIGMNCIVGPYARLRPNSELANEVHIGNFVELKNVLIASNCKINHHAFVADATLGSGVLIGAGTITSNYDRGIISKIIIEDNAFIGSGVTLVAPLVVEESAVIAAGSTVIKNAPKGSLTIARAKQVVLDNWVENF